MQFEWYWSLTISYLCIYLGPQYTFYLLIYKQSHRAVKNKIRIEDIITIRSGKQNSFHIYLNNGMFLFFRAESLDSKSAWMADLRMALDKGL